jgi:hypothetical protein
MFDWMQVNVMIILQHVWKNMVTLTVDFVFIFVLTVLNTDYSPALFKLMLFEDYCAIRESIYV